jgi:GTP-binding protein HflX
MRVVEDTLRTLGFGDRPKVVVLNKADRLGGPEGDALREALGGEMPQAIWASATEGSGIDELRSRLAQEATRGWRTVTVRLPYSAGALLQRIREHGSLRSAEYGESGIEVEAEVPPAFAAEIERVGTSLR